ncbi:MAG TPA: hypothetical protein ENN73_05495 [Firmicutes bacterium]|nr:hypothetical protein [Bacillota bacterium]
MIISFFIRSFAVPVTLIQILWINLLTDGFPAAALSFDPATRDVMNSPPRKPNEKLFTGRLLYDMMKRGIKIAAGTIIAFSLGYYFFGKEIPHDSALVLGRTMAFCTIVFSQLIYVFLIRGKEKLGLRKRVFGNRYLFFALLASITAQIIVLAVPQMNSVFNTVFPNLIQWGVIIVISILSAFI